MGVFTRRKGRHADRGDWTGWGGLARIAVDAAAHPVVDARLARPVLAGGVYRVSAPGWIPTSEENR